MLRKFHFCSILFFVFLTGCSSVSDIITTTGALSQSDSKVKKVDCANLKPALPIVKDAPARLKDTKEYKSVYDTYMYRALSSKLGSKRAAILALSLNLPSREQIDSKIDNYKVLVLYYIDDDLNSFLKKNCAFKGYVGLANNLDLENRVGKKSSTLTYVFDASNDEKRHYCMEKMLVETTAKKGANVVSYLTGISPSDKRLRSLKTFTYKEGPSTYILMKTDYYWQVTRLNFDKKKKKYVYGGVIERYSSTYQCPEDVVKQLKNSPNINATIFESSK